MRSIVLLLAVALVGCGSSDTCAQNPASCGDAGDGTCTGQCVPVGAGFNVYLWSGPAGSTPPPCPSVLIEGSGSTRGFLDGPPSKVTCSPACTCSPSGNECVLPSTITASTATCPAGSGAPFDAPAVWDGKCSTMDPVGSAKSVTVDPPTLPFLGMCEPATPNVVTVEGGGATIALTCQGPAPSVTGVCLGSSQECSYPNAPGFTICTTPAGSSCADVPGWPVQHTFYQPSCTCTCGSPVGEACSTTVIAYEDGSCANAVGSASLTSNDSATCSNLTPSPSALGSKKATVTYTPGNCAATLTPIAPETLCCLN
jgi:hypothetical protein